LSLLSGASLSSRSSRGLTIVASKPPGTPRATRAIRLFAVGAALAVGVGLTVFLLDPSHSRELLEATRRLGWLGPIVYVALHAVAVVVLLPGVFFPLAAGFLFGVWVGTVYSVLGKVLGSLIAFAIARRMLGGSDSGMPRRARRAFERYPLLHALHSQLDRGDWRTVMLIRLVPLIPFKLSNYMFGWMGFRFRALLWGTLWGTVPYSLINAYLGSLAADLPTLVSSTTSARAGWVTVLPVVLTTGASLLIGRRALTLLRRAAQQPDEPKQDEPQLDEPQLDEPGRDEDASS
jgi:uncharacterized membrane protein YdjX (TVP38/TMEM64 family)